MFCLTGSVLLLFLSKTFLGSRSHLSGSQESRKLLSVLFLSGHTVFMVFQPVHFLVPGDLLSPIHHLSHNSCCSQKQAFHNGGIILIINIIIIIIIIVIIIIIIIIITTIIIVFVLFCFVFSLFVLFATEIVFVYLNDFLSLS